MPRQLKEIKRFNTGTILNASERDIPQDSPAFSLNVDPMSENGILQAIKNDRIVATIYGSYAYANPITWHETSNNTLTPDNTANFGKTIFKDFNILILSL